MSHITCFKCWFHHLFLVFAQRQKLTSNSRFHQNSDNKTRHVPMKVEFSPSVTYSKSAQKLVCECLRVRNCIEILVLKVFSEACFPTIRKMLLNGNIANCSMKSVSSFVHHALQHCKKDYWFFTQLKLFQIDLDPRK